MPKCGYCRKRRMLQQEGGFWDSKKDAGIIAGHGRIVTGKFLVIPEGFNLRPLGTLGKKFDLGTMSQDDLELFETKEVRGYQFNLPSDLIVTKGSVGHVYKAGDVIPEMLISMQLTWENENTQTNWVKKGNIGYFPAGIITEKKIPTPEVKQMRADDPKSEKIKEASMKYSDDSIKVEWFKDYLLSDLLKMIKEAGKAGSYWILACRSGDIVFNEQECGEEYIRKQLRSSIIDVLGSFTEKLDKISKYSFEYDFSKNVTRILRNNDTLKELFIDTFVNTIKYRLGENASIDTELLCKVNNMSFTKKIPLQLVESKKGDPAFKPFWDKVKIAYKEENESKPEIKKHKVCI